MMCIIFDRVGGLQLSSAVNCENANDKQKKETASFKLSGECINIISVSWYYYHSNDSCDY